jgi:dGTPase
MGSRHERGAGRYDAHARARWAPEPPKESPRGPFERDRARLVHSAALRRLAAKTQVVGPGSDDFVRNRLTHTLEVAQVARDLAVRLGCDPDITEAAALAHDVGHPPFGHNGERALDELAAPAGGFEGNAQTLRVLTRLEAKRLDPSGRSVGLNLTRASLDAASKYPWQRTPARGGKFGVYADDLPVFTWLRQGAPDDRPCLEAQVMDLADDIAYSVHDLEDGVVAGRIDPAGLRDPGVRRVVWDTVRSWYLPHVQDVALDESWRRLADATQWPAAAYDGSRGAQAGLKDLTSNLVGLFCSEATDATHEKHGGGPLVRYEADLVVPERTALAIAVLKGLAAHFVMQAEDRVAALEEQRRMLVELVHALLDRAPGSLEPALRDDYAAAGDDAGRLRVVVDQVASLTDASAVRRHARLT